MNRKEFDVILIRCGVANDVFDIWWGHWIKYTTKFNVKSPHSSLEIFAKKIVEKGCCANAPW